ncbi:unnamed protein product [Ectocarpus sp. 13 AM-2016]
MGFGLVRETEIVCGVRQDDGSSENMSYTFGAKDMGWEKELMSFPRVKLSSARLEVDMEWMMTRMKSYFEVVVEKGAPQHNARSQKRQPSKEFMGPQTAWERMAYTKDEALSSTGGKLYSRKSARPGG